MRDYLVVVSLALVLTNCSAASGDELSTRGEDTDNTAAALVLDAKRLTPGYTQTRYPIVLLHGLLGFRKILGTLDYFPGVASTLEEDGARVFVVQASQANTSVVRGEQLIPQLEKICAITGAPRLNLIGHSQGSLDARYIAAVRPDLVASVTGVGGPHKGSKVADFMLRIPLGAETLTGLAELIKLVSGSENQNDGRAALIALSTEGTAAFNLRFPAGIPATACGSGNSEVSNVRYYSWSSVGGLTNPLDLFDPILALAGTMAKEANDGLVEKCSAHLGEVIRDDYRGNHIDQTNLMVGLVSPFGPNPKSLFRAHANRLRNAGL